MLLHLYSLCKERRPFPLILRRSETWLRPKSSLSQRHSGWCRLSLWWCIEQSSSSADILYRSIQLGETFSGVVCVNNESFHPGMAPTSISLRVEMQTATAKLPIGSADSDTLTPSSSIQTIVHHEIKELGQHVLGCTVSYRLPPALVGSYPVPPENPDDPTLRVLRKFYKFMVSSTSPSLSLDSSMRLSYPRIR